jgi:glycosyltransferase involved in cell wall biosynthesis
MAVSTSPVVSVVIPYYNRGRALRQTLLGLANQTADPSAFEAIVVDDGSTDGSVLGVQRLGLPYRLEIIRQPHRGPGAARNRGAGAANSKHII